MAGPESASSSGWSSPLARFSAFYVLFLTVTGLAITFGPFHAAVQWGLLWHTAIGVLALAPVLWYAVSHWWDYRRYSLSSVVLLGYVGAIGFLVCLVSGVVVTVQGVFDVRMSPTWRSVHLISTYVTIGGIAPHVLLLIPRVLKSRLAPAARGYAGSLVAWTVAGTIVAAALAFVYPGASYENEFPDDYSYVYGEERPFAPSLARTSTGGAFDSGSLAGSESCGTTGCHSQILAEWRPSAHRYSAMDKVFQSIQNVMAKQNGAESTRYCGGCHDPISLFSGTKNIFVENLTNLAGYNEGVSCLACHAIQETDLAGNANYVITQPHEYLWQWQDQGLARVARDFLIRTYPDEHAKLSKRMYKAPEYCAACHKQFIDEEVNQVGWVQLQNQYDNWKASHWYHEGDPSKTIECRECHMPLVDSNDPAAGDDSDYNRTPGDGKHRSHRFIASNQLMPKLLELEGWEEQVALTEEWLKGHTEIPEIQQKWAEGPIVKLAIDVPGQVAAGESIPLRVVFTSNKVGHDYPTGPLDIIQSWLEIEVRNDAGEVVYTSGTTDEKHFIEPGSFLFKAEPVDQYGNLIDRHNLWEMVGVRFRRALFPGFSDAVEFRLECPGSAPASPTDGDTATASSVATPPPGEANTLRAIELPAQTGGQLRVTARLKYRKVDQFLLNFLYGEDAGITAPIVEIDQATTTIQVVGA